MEKKHRGKCWLAVGILLLAAALLFAIPSAVTAVSSLSGRRQLLFPADSLQDAFSQTQEGLEQLEDSLPSPEPVTPEPPAEPAVSGGPEGSIAPEEAEAIDELIDSFGGGVSVYYKSLTEGDTYSYAANTEYYIASVVKAPYALYAYQLADAGALDLSQEYTFQSRHWQGGSKYFQRKDIGKKYTMGQLLEYTIRYSDNNAFKIVREEVSVDGFKQFVRTLGLERENCMDALTAGSGIRGNISAHDAGIIAEKIYQYMEGDSPNAGKLKEDMLHTEQPMLQSSYPMARKLGSWEDAMHDVAIIYAPEPYVLAVCTNRGHTYDSWYTDADYDIFIKISAMVEALSQN